MSDVDTEVRELLRQKADEMDGASQMPRPVLRRARRRRALNGTLAAATAAAVIVGAFVGGQALLRPRSERGPAGNTSPTVTTPGLSQDGLSPAFAAIWPERNADELRAEQTRVKEHPDVDGYRLDPKETAIEFAHQVLNWDPTIIDAKVKVPPGGAPNPPLEVELHFGTLIREEGLPPQAPYGLIVTVQQLGNTGDLGIWSVTRVRSDLVQLSCDITSAVEVDGSVHVCGTTAWDPPLATAKAWATPGDAATTGLDPDEASPSQDLPLASDGSFDGELGPVPSGFGGSTVVVVEVLDQEGSPVGVAAQKISIASSTASPAATP
jgi:hypothetical protein